VNRAVLWILTGIAATVRAQSPAPQTRSVDDALTAIRRASDFLVKDQNPDGSWGGAGGAVYTFTGDVWSNPETHRAWRVATTGLGVAALLRGDSGDAAARSAADAGLDYVLASADVRRPSEWDTMHSWAYIYGLEAVAAAYASPLYAGSPKRGAMETVAALFVRRLGQCESLAGGWGYLEFDAPRTPQPQWSTSFTTAAGIVALLDARRAGLPIDEDMLNRGTRAIRRCEMPSGAYTYSVQPLADPRHSEWIDQIKGSLGRIQACNYARLAGGEALPEARLLRGLDDFFQHHRFMDIARNKPIPHETYYLNSGYFYLFGHYYAARLIASLPEPRREPYWTRLRHEIIKIQQADGSLYDYDMHAYHKPYGSALGILGLAGTLPPPKKADGGRDSQPPP
jgi:hypothetical protein